jgi:hypothetical protein
MGGVPGRTTRRDAARLVHGRVRHPNGYELTTPGGDVIIEDDLDEVVRQHAPPAVRGTVIQNHRVQRASDEATPKGLAETHRQVP